MSTLARGDLKLQQTAPKWILRWPMPMPLQAALVALVALAVLVPRGLSISQAQSMRVDDGYHLSRGIRFWHRDLTAGWTLNDPPLGEAISALPILWSSELPPAGRLEISDIAKLSQASLDRIAVFKSILFVPAVVLVFWWVAGCYGPLGGWLAAALTLVDPTLAAHVPLPTIDALGAEMILFACFITWQCLEKPTWPRLVGTAVLGAAALLTKHTALIWPGVALVMLVLQVMVKPLVVAQAKWPALPQWRRGFGQLMAVIAMTLLCLWALVLLDISKPEMPVVWPHRPVWAIRLTGIGFRIPAGMYISSLLQAIAHGDSGHASLLFGHTRNHGWWYYFPAIASMKVPLGFFVIMMTAAASLLVQRPRWREWSLLLPAVAWTAFIMSSKLSIGFRHILPAYIFLLMLCGRALLLRGHGWRLVVCTALTWAVVDVVHWHPDEMSYTNRPIENVWLKMGDSNLDWGQGDRAAGDWVLNHVPPDRRVTLVHFTATPLPAWAGKNVFIGNAFADRHEQPTRGVLIVSPNWVTGQYDSKDQMRALRRVHPTDIIGHCLLVYDLDILSGGKGFNWMTSTPTLRDREIFKP